MLTGVLFVEIAGHWIVPLTSIIAALVITTAAVELLILLMTFILQVKLV